MRFAYLNQSINRGGSVFWVAVTWSIGCRIKPWSETVLHFNNILFPVDFSARSLQSAPYVAAIAKKFNSKITLLHIVEGFNPFGYGSFSSTMAYGADASELRRRAEEEITSFASSVLRQLCISRVIEFGKPGQGIARFACQHNMDLVAMPTHGYGGFKRLLLGSVTNEVLRRAACPVWTTAHTEQFGLVGGEPNARIICGVDLGPQSMTLLGIACDLASKYGATLRLVHAVGSDLLAADSPFQRFLFDTATSEMSELQRLAHTQFETCIRQGDPAAVMRAAALEDGAQLMIIGRGQVRSLLGGLRTDVNNIIRESPCPVLSV